MNTPLHSRALVLILLTAAALAAAMDAGEIVRLTVAADENNWKAARNYGFLHREDSRRLDPEGRLKSQDVKVFDVTLLEGSPYRTLVWGDNRPLPPAEERREQEKLARCTAERRKENTAQRALRLANYESRPEWQREAWRKLPEAFSFRLAAEETWAGRGLYVIVATPRQGYQPKSRTGKGLLHLKGKLWVDKQNYHLVKADMEAIDTISLGLVLVRLAKGSRATFEQARVNDEVWMPSQVNAFIAARLGQLKVLHIEQEISYSECREFQVGSSTVAQVNAR
jgi:hypothetical protein